MGHYKNIEANRKTLAAIEKVFACQGMLLPEFWTANAILSKNKAPKAFVKFGEPFAPISDNDQRMMRMHQRILVAEDNTSLKVLICGFQDNVLFYADLDDFEELPDIGEGWISSKWKAKGLTKGLNGEDNTGDRRAGSREAFKKESANGQN